MFSKNKALFRALSLGLSVVFAVFALAGCMPADGTAAGGEGADASAAAGMGGMTLILYLVVIILVFYFFMIRPEKKRKKKAQEMRDSLAVGDNIVTIGGMVGKIVNVSGEYVTFETGEDRVRIKIAKWGISSTGKDAEEPDEKASN